MSDETVRRRGRGAVTNGAGRFERYSYERDPEVPPDAAIPTQIIEDRSKTIIARNQSPDVGFETSVNPYRGCEHGCAYCFARPTHEYLGFSAGIDFETKILVKSRAAELLREELASSRWVPQTIAISGVTDPYQPLERKLRLTRSCLEVLEETKNPVVIITKNELVTRDVDLLGRLAEENAAAVCLSITTLDARLTGSMEPRSSRPEARLRAVRTLSDHGIPVGVLVAPVIPALNDHEIPAILDAAAEAGASFSSYVLLRLPLSVAPVFEAWLRENYPDRAEKVLNRVRDTRGGELYESTFGVRGRGRGKWADQIRSVFEIARRRAGIDGSSPELNSESFVRPNLSGQKSLF